MKPKHTPGPWIVRESSQGYIDIVAKRNHIGLANVARVLLPREPQDAANAHLIAAAPEMLAALKLALEQIEPTPKPKLIHTPGFALRMIREAVAKAEGNNP